jgi:hypothetical protein
MFFQFGLRMLAPTLENGLTLRSLSGDLNRDLSSTTFRFLSYSLCSVNKWFVG